MKFSLINNDENKIKDFGFTKYGESMYKYTVSLYKSKKKDIVYADFLLYPHENKMTVNVIDGNTNMGYTPFYQKSNYQNLVSHKVMVNYKKIINKLAKAGIVGKEDEDD